MFEIESLGFHGFMVDTITAIKFITELGGVGGLVMVVLVMTAVLMVAAMVRSNYLIVCLVVVFVVLVLVVE